MPRSGCACLIRAFAIFLHSICLKIIYWWWSKPSISRQSNLSVSFRKSFKTSMCVTRLSWQGTEGREKDPCACWKSENANPPRRKAGHCSNYWINTKMYKSPRSAFAWCSGHSSSVYSHKRFQCEAPWSLIWSLAGPEFWAEHNFWGQKG